MSPALYRVVNEDGRPIKTGHGPSRRYAIYYQLRTAQSVATQLSRQYGVTYAVQRTYTDWEDVA